MRLVYVIDYRATHGFLCRVPRFVGRFIARHVPFHDTTVHPWGEAPDPEVFTGPEVYAESSRWVGWRTAVAVLRTWGR